VHVVYITARDIFGAVTYPERKWLKKVKRKQGLILHPNESI